MFKRITLTIFTTTILSTFIPNASLVFASVDTGKDITKQTNIANINTTANIALDNILTYAIDAIIKAKSSNKTLSTTKVKQLITTKLIPFIDGDLSAKKSLPSYWKSLNLKQKNNLKNYILNSLIKDYAGVLSKFDNFNTIKLKVNPKIKTKGRLAIVSVDFINQASKNAKPLTLIVKMIKNQYWQVYDIVFSGVSLIKNYKSRFNSYIKRKGFAKFSTRYLTNKINK